MFEKHCSEEGPCQRYKDLMLGLSLGQAYCVFTWRQYRLVIRMFPSFVDKLFVYVLVFIPLNYGL